MIDVWKTKIKRVLLTAFFTCCYICVAVAEVHLRDAVYTLTVPQGIDASGKHIYGREAPINYERSTYPKDGDAKYVSIVVYVDIGEDLVQIDYIETGKTAAVRAHSPVLQDIFR